MSEIKPFLYDIIEKLLSRGEWEKWIRCEMFLWIDKIGDRRNLYQR